MMIDTAGTVHSLYAAFQRGDLATILAACDPEIEWVSNADPELIPWGGHRKGVQQAKKFFAVIAEHVEFESFQPLRFFPGEDSVAVLGRTIARLKPSGGHFDSEWAHLFAFGPDGKVTMFREFYDTNALVRAYLSNLPANTTAAKSLEGGEPLTH
jgi:ketosteroid isomerase-like protein